MSIAFKLKLSLSSSVVVDDRILLVEDLDQLFCTTVVFDNRNFRRHFLAISCGFEFIPACFESLTRQRSSNFAYDEYDCLYSGGCAFLKPHFTNGYQIQQEYHMNRCK